MVLIDGQEMWVPPGMDEDNLKSECKSDVNTPIKCDVKKSGLAVKATQACKDIQTQQTAMEEAIRIKKLEVEEDEAIITGIGAVVTAVAVVGLTVATGGGALVVIAAGAAAGAGAGAGIGMGLGHLAKPGASTANKSFSVTDLSDNAVSISEVQNLMNTNINQSGVNVLTIKGCDFKAMFPGSSKLSVDARAEAFAASVAAGPREVSDINQELSNKVTVSAVLDSVAKLVRTNTNDITSTAYMNASAKALGSPASSTNMNCNVIDASVNTCDYLRTINCCANNINSHQSNILKVEACGVNASGLTQKANAEVIASCGGTVTFNSESTHTNTMVQTITEIGESIAANPYALVALVACVGVVVIVVIYIFASDKNPARPTNQSLSPSHRQAGHFLDMPYGGYPGGTGISGQSKKAPHAGHGVQTPAVPALGGGGYRSPLRKMWRKYKLLFLITGALYVIHITSPKKINREV